MAYPATPKSWVAGDVLTAAQMNAQLRDAFLGAFPLGPPDVAWTAWTPTFTNFTLGNGTVDAKYSRVGRSVWFRILVTLGSTSVMGSTPKFSLPVARHAGYAATQVIGVASIGDFGTADFGAVLWAFSATEAQLIVQSASGAYVTAAVVGATVPMTWTTSDSFNAFGMYEAA